MSEAQSYANHRRYVWQFHILLVGIVVLSLAGAIYGFVRRLQWGAGRIEALSQLLLVIAVAILMWYARIFALKAQDRAIRAEESLRHYLLTGKPIDPRLRIGQVIALRFASDEELPELARRAAEEGMRADAIKQAVKTWRPDLHRA
jgi:hypothetical protein